MSSVALLSAHVVAFHLKPVAFFAIHPLFSLPYIAPFCFQYINWRTELSSNLTKTNTVLENRKPIFIDSTAQGTANLDTNSFLKAGVTYAFIVIVSSNISSESYKQEIACALNNVNMGNNGNYYKLVSTFTGKCSKGDKLHITSYKNGGTWTLFTTRAIFIPVS
jgi:hypothetical protein